MNVDSFVELYRADWERLDHSTRRGHAALRRLGGPELDEVIRLYLRTSAHLAEARGRYREPDLVAYLTAVVGRAHAAIYGARSRSARDVARNLGARYRVAVRATAPFIWVSAALFLVVSGFAVIWVATSPEAQAGVIPPGAEQAIREFTGDDFGGSYSPAAFSTVVLINNIQVAFLGFAGGITFGLGTLFVLLYNAMYLGIVAGAFVALGRGGPFWSVVLPHGLLELTAIFIACGAGLRMGWALVAPGDRPRTGALAEAAAAAVLVVAGVVPAFVVAGVIEGFVSGSSLLPAWIELGIGAAVWAAYAAFLLWPAQRRPKALARRYASATATASSPGDLSTTHAPS